MFDICPFPLSLNWKTVQGDYTISPAIFSNGYHIPLIRHNLTRALPTVFPAVVEELKVAFEEYVPCSPASDEWITVKALDSIMRTICQASNITFVGSPLCRNKEYMDVMLKYTIDVMTGAQIIGLFPKFLRPWVVLTSESFIIPTCMMESFAGRFVSNTRRRFNAAKKHMFPMIEARYRKLEEHNYDWACLPVSGLFGRLTLLLDDLPRFHSQYDMLTWHMQTAEGVEKTPESLTYRSVSILAAVIVEWIAEIRNVGCSWSISSLYTQWVSSTFPLYFTQLPFVCYVNYQTTMVRIIHENTGWKQFIIIESL